MNKERISLGIIGLSEGNGHPYSWSAIFNGYDKLLMENCGFPVIPRYLEKQSFPDDCIKEARVNYIWTQSKKLSEKISNTCLIENVAYSILDMIGKVDGILLARDDAENHFKFAEPFLKRGIPVYIDKPLALNLIEAKKILNLRLFESQIFTCTALKYAKEFLPSDQELQSIGKIKSIHGEISKDWNRYSIHIIEPILNLVPNRGELISYSKESKDDMKFLNLKFKFLENMKISTLGKMQVTPKICIHGENGNLVLKLKDTFNAFRTALNIFIESILDKESRLDEESLLEIIKFIELGN